MPAEPSVVNENLTTMVPAPREPVRRQVRRISQLRSRSRSKVRQPMDEEQAARRVQQLQDEIRSMQSIRDRCASQSLVDYFEMDLMSLALYACISESISSSLEAEWAWDSNNPDPYPVSERNLHSKRLRNIRQMNFRPLLAMEPQRFDEEFWQKYVHWLRANNDERDDICLKLSSYTALVDNLRNITRSGPDEIRQYLVSQHSQMWDSCEDQSYQRRIAFMEENDAWSDGWKPYDIMKKDIEDAGLDELSHSIRLKRIRKYYRRDKKDQKQAPRNQKSQDEIREPVLVSQGQKRWSERFGGFLPPTQQEVDENFAYRSKRPRNEE